MCIRDRFQYVDTEDISHNPRENNGGDGNGGVAAEFLRYAHTNRCSNGFGEQGDIRGMVKPEAVSYTHLDVYKRQVYSIAKQRCRPKINEFAVETTERSGYHDS